MPANVTPIYEKAEQRFREATTDQERIIALQEMLSTIPKHKGTEKMQADIKRRLSHLRKEEHKAGHAKGPDPFHVPKSGAGQVVLVGLPNVGKSSLLAATTNADVKVADYPYTTQVPQPGIWHWNDLQIELVDTPPVAPNHVPAGLLGTVRSADVVNVIAEAGDGALNQVESVVTLLGEKDLHLASRPRNELAEFGANQRPGMIVLTKADLVSEAMEHAETLRDLYEGRFEVVAVSARSGQGLDAWFEHIWQLLASIRVYAKQPGRPPDLSKPFTMPVGSTIEDLARHIHRDLPQTMKFARIWGAGRFDGQHVHRAEPLRDRDVVEIHE